MTSMASRKRSGVTCKWLYWSYVSEATVSLDDTLPGVLDYERWIAYGNTRISLLKKIIT